MNRSSRKAYELLTNGTANDPELFWTEALNETSYGFELWAKERLRLHLDPGEMDAVEWDEVQRRVLDT